MPSIDEFCETMRWLCEDANVGYDQNDRWDIRPGGECDCSSLVIWCLRDAGFDTGDATYTGNLSDNLTARGWERLEPDISACRRGDILLNDAHHVCAVIAGEGWGATIAQASIDERGRASGGEPGDQTGYETNTRAVYDYPWDCILRYSGEVDTDGSDAGGWAETNAGWTFVEDGQAATGWRYLGGSWFYFDPGDGDHAALTGFFRPEGDGRSFHADSEGRMTTGWVASDAGWTYADGTGELQSGWRYLGGSWFWFDTGTVEHAAATGYFSPAGDTRLFHADGDGRLSTGWFSDGGAWHFADGNGELQSGWHLLGGSWFYFDPAQEGYPALTGERDVAGARCIFDGQGRLDLRSMVMRLDRAAQGK